MKKPPRIARWILSVTNRKRNREIVLGDFEEFYNERLSDYGWLYAYFWFYTQAFRSIPSFLFTSLYWGITMFSNYFKISFRNIFKYKGYSFINIFGLATGLASCILIFLFITYETSFDEFYSKADRIYIVAREERHPSQTRNTLGNPFPFTEAMRNDFLELEAATQIYGVEETQITVDTELFTQNNILFTEPQFFKMFDVEYIMGYPTNNLKDPNSIIITEGIAKKYFGNNSPLDKNIKIDNLIDLTVVGVVKDPPPNTSLPYTAIASVKALTKIFWEWI